MCYRGRRMKNLALVCERCDSVDIDIKYEQGYAICNHCNTKILIDRKTEGDISKAKNCVRIADRAFEIKNFKQAYEYYLKALEYNGDSPWVLFRKGFSSILLSKKNIQEFKISLKDAVAVFCNEEWNAQYRKMLQELSGYVKQNMERIASKCKKYINRIPSKEEFQKYDDDLKFLTEIVVTLCEVTENEKIADYSESEDLFIDSLKLGMEICMKGQEGVKYFNGTKIVKNGEQEKEKRIIDIHYSKYSEWHHEKYKILRDRHNDMPSIVKQKKYYDTRIMECENLKDDLETEYNTGFDEYLIEHPEKKNILEQNTARIYLYGICMFATVYLMIASSIGRWNVVCVLGLVYLAYKTLIIYCNEQEEKDKVFDELPLELISLDKKIGECDETLQKLYLEKKEFEKNTILE